MKTRSPWTSRIKWTLSTCTHVSTDQVPPQEHPGHVARGVQACCDERHCARVSTSKSLLTATVNPALASSVAGILVFRCSRSSTSTTTGSSRIREFCLGPIKQAMDAPVSSMLRTPPSSSEPILFCLTRLEQAATAQKQRSRRSGASLRQTKYRFHDRKRTGTGPRPQASWSRRRSSSSRGEPLNFALRFAARAATRKTRSTLRQHVGSSLVGRVVGTKYRGVFSARGSRGGAE